MHWGASSLNSISLWQHPQSMMHTWMSSILNLCLQDAWGASLISLFFLKTCLCTFLVFLLSPCNFIVQHLNTWGLSFLTHYLRKYEPWKVIQTLRELYRQSLIFITFTALVYIYITCVPITLYCVLWQLHYLCSYYTHALFDFGYQLAYRRTGFNCENLTIANCEFSRVRKLLIRRNKLA